MGDSGFDAQVDPEIAEFGRVIREALAGAGGFELVMRSESDRELRLREIEPVLQALGVLELDPLGGVDQLQASAVAARAGGYFALPYPVAERLAGNTLDGADPLALAVIDGRQQGAGGRARVNHADLPFDWRAVDIRTGRVATLRAGGSTGRRLGPFVAETTVEEPVAAPEAVLPLALVLPLFTLLGLLESVLDVTRAHVNDRVQFGAPLVSFQAVQHQLADALIAFELFEQQAHYGLWSFATDRAALMTDVVGARLSGLRAADRILRVGHQLHGATGFADESAVSWLSRHSQPLRRLPVGPARTESWFTDLVLRSGFDGLFPETVTAPAVRGPLETDMEGPDEVNGSADVNGNGPVNGVGPASCARLAAVPGPLL